MARPGIRACSAQAAALLAGACSTPALRLPQPPLPAGVELHRAVVELLDRPLAVQLEDTG